MALRQSSCRRSQHPKGPPCTSTTCSRSDALIPHHCPHSIPRARTGIRLQNPAPSLPFDIWTRLLPWLTWRATNAMLCVCRAWRNVVKEAKTLHPEWRSTVLGPSVNGSDSLELLRTNHLKWADTCFAPDLILLVAASKDASPWHRGGYWEEAIAAIEAAGLLPPPCRIAGVFTMNAVLGTSEEEEEGTAASSAVTLSVSVAHLVDTTVEMAAFDRKDLRWCHRGLELKNPFTALEHDVPSFLMFGVNDQSARQLVATVAAWYPGAALVGAVSPLNDRCVPLATYCGGVAALAGCRDRQQTNRKTKQNARRRRRPPRPRGHVVFPVTMLLRLHGKVGIRALSSSGYRPITPVIQCVHSSIAEELSQVVTHDLVATRNHDRSSDATLHRVVALLDPSERLAIERKGRGLNIFSCQDSAPLEHLVDRCSASQNKAPMSTSAQIDRLECVFWLQNRLMSLPNLGWQEGAYGILASHHPTWTSRALAEALRSTQLSLANEHVIGAFMVAGALNEVDDLTYAKEVGQLCTGILRRSQLGGCVVSISVGPVALPGGVQLSAGRGIAQVQTHTTCGAVFYMKTGALQSSAHNPDR